MQQTHHQQSFNIKFSSDEIISFFQVIRQQYPDAVILENAESGILKKTIISFDKIAETTHQQTFEELRKFIRDFSCAPTESLGHIIGFVSYDAIRLFESIPDTHVTDSFPLFAFNIYRTSFCFLHQENKLFIQQIGNTETADIPALLALFQEKPNQTPIKKCAELTELSTPEIDINDETFKTLIQKAKDYIKAGDIFQVVLSRTFKQAYTQDPFNIYLALRKNYPTPYLFYIPMPDFYLIGASPETCVKVKNREVTLNPIAGTSPRKNNLSTIDIENDLLNDQKELAEHMMLVDLARNDVGRISVPGSVKVTELLKVKHFSHLSHITSTVTGTLLPHLDALDALAAAFPAGTLSGAPKIRAMEIIDELENSRRNLYGGAICCLDFAGNLDSCIAIRTAMIKDGNAYFRTGAGIVFDSDPQAEVNETYHKAQAMITAIQSASQMEAM